MYEVRYFFAVMMLVTVPSAIGLWYLIHPFAAFWRRFGAALTYTILAVPTGAFMWATWRVRDTLLARDLGWSPALTAVSVGLVIIGGVIAQKRRKLLTQRILLGVPELSSTDRGHLLTTGIYARVRNPWYLEFIFFILGYVAFANFMGTWILFVLILPATHLLVLMEERELRDRFGAEYEDYCRQVPRWIPRRPPGIPAS